MANKSIVFICEDEAYISTIEYKLAELVGEKADIEYLTTSNAVRKFYKYPRKVDVLILPLNEKQTLSQEYANTKVIYLTEEESSGDKNKIFKYSSARAIVDKIDGSLLAKENDKRTAGTQIISVFSVGGGNGKTLMALATANNLQKMGKRVLYISTESCQDFSYYLNKTDELSTEFCYQCTINIRNSLKLLKNEIKNEGFDFLPPFRKFPVAYQMKLDTYIKIVNYLKAKNIYDYIVVEFSKELQSEKLSFLKDCNRNIIVTTQDMAAVRKLEDFFENMLDLRSTISIICNRYKNNQQNYLAESKIAKEYEIVDYVQEYSDCLTWDTVKYYNMFSKAISYIE